MKLDDYCLRFMANETDERVRWFKDHLRAYIFSKKNQISYKTDITRMEILCVVCLVLELNIDKVTSRSRLPRLVRARTIYHYLARKMTHYSLELIAEPTNRSHAIALRSIKEIKKVMSNPNSYPRLYDEYMSCVEATHEYLDKRNKTAKLAS